MLRQHMSTQTYNSKRTAADEAGVGSLPSTLDTTGSKLEMLTLLPTLGTLEAAGLVERHGDTVRVTA